MTRAVAIAVRGAVVAAPELVTEAVTREGYRRAYRLAGECDECVVQQVGVHVRHHVGGHALVDYRARYAEFFRGVRDGAQVLDVHDFDLRRDGWRQANLLALLRRCGARAGVGTSGEPRLSVTKVFTLARGVVHGDAAVPVGDGVQFGFLTHGPAGASTAVLRWRDHGAAAWRSVPVPTPFPAARGIGGVGAFAGAHAWRTVEHWTHDFACLRGALRAGAGYRPISLTHDGDCP